MCGLLLEASRPAETVQDLSQEELDDYKSPCNFLYLLNTKNPQEKCFYLLLIKQWVEAVAAGGKVKG